ncbi:MAG: Rrf2 family transcriptional regulator [Deltaproteobacteria bacterium]|nr:Rrf2 family transcriptional regulator [Deltaproteobacteria bacterium]
MKLSTRARYGLRGVFDIAYHNRGESTHVKDIARRQGVTPRYLEQIFQALKKAGILAAVRGPRGGYYLARPAAEIRVGDVVRATEGPIRFESPPGPPKQGERDRGERFLAEVWDELGERVEGVLDGISLEDLCARGEAAGLSRETPADQLMYFI